MKCQFPFFVLVLFVIKEFSCLPIFTEEESLKSIVISDLELPTEPSFLLEKYVSEDAEKSESFVELYEKYNEKFIKDSTTELNEGDEAPLQKRSSINDDQISEEDESSKSIIEKMQAIADPEVRKEFELELKNNGQIAESESEEPTKMLTDYDPKYAQKVVNVSNMPAEMQFSAEQNSVHTEFQTVPYESEKILLEDITTLQPSLLRDTGFIEVFEQVFYHPTEELEDDVISGDTIVQVDFDPIQIIPEEFRSLNTDVTTVAIAEDFTATPESTTPDKIMSVYEKTVYDTTQPTGISGKSINNPNFSDETEANDILIYGTTTEVPATLFEDATTAPTFQVTEIVEVNTEISVSIKSDVPSSEKPQKSPTKELKSVKKVSEEDVSSKSSEESGKSDKSSADSSSEENTAKEMIDNNEFKTLDLRNTGDQESLMDDLFKDTSRHEIIKKDQPIVLSETKNSFLETVARNLNNEKEISQLAEKYPSVLVETEGNNDVTTSQIIDVTTIGIYETFEDVITTVADGIELSKELRTSVDSFRSFTDESKTILDTNNEAFSSKNIKNSLVNIAEEMTLENHSRNVEMSYFVAPIAVIGSLVVLSVLFVTLRQTFARLDLF